MRGGMVTGRETDGVEAYSTCSALPCQLYRAFIIIIVFVSQPVVHCSVTSLGYRQPSKHCSPGPASSRVGMKMGRMGESQNQFLWNREFQPD